MARLRMVTRTVDVTVAQVMVVNITTAQVETKEFTFIGKLDDKGIIEMAQVDETTKPVHVISKTVAEELYGMPEQDFVRLAKKLPPRTKVEE